MRNYVLILIAMFTINPLFTKPVYSEDKDIKLEDHQSSLNVDLITVLQNRKSTRGFTDKEISLKDLSTILWAANGINRYDGKRTAPSLGLFLPLLCLL